MKLYISNTGITESIKTNVNDTRRDLNSAKNMYISCPSSFRYSSYIYSLKTKVNDFVRELNYINNSLTKSERKYNNKFDEQISKTKSITEKKMPVKKALNKDLF